MPKQTGTSPADSQSRYTDHGNGTIIDNRTQLIWLKDANCFGLQDWDSAQKYIHTLADGQYGLCDGSKLGSWRLPTKTEWIAMMDTQYTWPALSNGLGTAKWTNCDIFEDVQASWYWSSSTLSFAPSYIWYANLFYGKLFNTTKNFTRFVWPVRDNIIL
ncbi:MAG: DUF1566 domain-containing protein [Thiomargarita sp.]|nr:DUF1566 domain-containing protein [Thiomargarita sp.]